MRIVIKLILYIAVFFMGMVFAPERKKPAKEDRKAREYGDYIAALNLMQDYTPDQAYNMRGK